MTRIDDPLDALVWQGGEVERFVRLIVGGGCLLVAGLWSVALTVRGSLPWLLGVAGALVGVALLAAGIGSRVEY